MVQLYVMLAAFLHRHDSTDTVLEGNGGGEATDGLTCITSPTFAPFCALHCNKHWRHQVPIRREEIQGLPQFNKY